MNTGRDFLGVTIKGSSMAAAILADYTSKRATIPAHFWAELKASKLIEQNAFVPA